MEDDSDDSDIFIEYQFKPVNKLTKREGLLIKNKVLRQTKLDFQGNVIISSEPDENVKREKRVTPVKKRKISVESPNPKRKSTEKARTGVNEKLSPARPSAEKSPNTTPIKLSPGVVQNVTPMKSPPGKSGNVTPINSPPGGSRIESSLKPSPGRSQNSTPVKQSPTKSPQRPITDFFSPTHSSAQETGKISVRGDLMLSHGELLVNADVLRRKKDIENYDEAQQSVALIELDSSSNDEISQEKTPTKKKKTKTSPKEEDDNSTSEKITLSPGIKRNSKRFKALKDIVGTGKKQAKKSPKKKLFSVPYFDENDKECIQPFKPKVSIVLENIKDIPDSETSNPESVRLDADILNFIIQNVIELQMYLKNSVESRKDKFNSLLTEDEINTLEKYTYLDRNSQTLFMRIFFRKPRWHRISSNTYTDLSSDLDNELRVLENVQYVQRDISKESLPLQLSLLKANELSMLGKSFNVANNNLKKEDLLNAIMTATKSQRSVLDLFKPTSAARRLRMVADETQKLLGPCFRINPECRQTISRIVLLFSIFHDVESEAKRAELQRYLLFQVLTGSLKFVSFDVVPTVIFYERQDFIEYEEALTARDAMEVAFKSKNHEDFTSTARASQWAFQRLVNDKEYCQRVSHLPSYLRRYSAGSTHAGILTMYCENFKRKLKVTESVDVLKLLLSQTVFGAGSRGKWYELQCQNYQNLKLIGDAANVLVTALRDESLNEVKKFALTLRGQSILKVKKNRLTDSNIREELESLCAMTIEEPNSVEICAQALSGNVTGSKLVYVQNTALGKRYSSVEEQAIYYYKRHGFTEGMHAEGFIVSTLFYIFFFDIIYSSVPGVFQSQYQDRPLDMYSASFYTSRKALIDARLQEINYWSSKSVAERIENVFAEYRDTCCAIAWKDGVTPLLLCEVVECIGLSAICEICKRFALTPRIARSGFPDLTLWNKETKKARFVEVKSPNDKLAPNQRLWLNYLRSAGIDCQVCNVRNIGSKFQ